MKKFICVILVLVMTVGVAGCGDKDTTEANNDLHSKAMSILDEFGDNQKVKDFLSAYDILMNLSENKDKFVSELGQANKYFEKYNVEFNHGDYFLTPNISLTSEDINDYRSKAAYYDAEDLMNAIVYPVLFDKYGQYAQCIKGISAVNILNAVRSTGELEQQKAENKYTGCEETWKYIGTPKSEFKIKYHTNGLVESINIPIVRSDRPLSDTELTEVYAKSVDEQKEFASQRFEKLIGELNDKPVGYTVLNQIFTDEEIQIIVNYIRSLSMDEIWERNMWTLNGTQATVYTMAAVSFDYKGNDISIHYGLDDIYLRIIGQNYVNEFSSKWYTLWCGLTLPNGSEKTIEDYADYINNKTEINGVVQDYSYDLDANADKYKNSTLSDPSYDETTLDISNAENFNISASDKITVKGYVERNTTEFPIYRFRLSKPITVTFKEYGEDEVFTCSYLYFYDDTELNGNYPFGDMVDAGREYSVTASLEDYRGGGDLFFLNPTMTNAN